MDYWTLFTVAIALGLDAFAVAVASGAYLIKTTGRQKFRLSFHFGLFQFMMPVLGWLAGTSIQSLIGNFDHWIVLAVLSGIGIKMIIESVSKNSTLVSTDITRGMHLVSLSVATSIDAMAVGFSIGIINDRIVVPSLIIGVIASSMTLFGIYIGEKLTVRFGGKILFIGGLVLIGIGVKVVLDHYGIW
jgi:putative Mn2+ efflux pump MntP